MARDGRQHNGPGRTSGANRTPLIAGALVVGALLIALLLFNLTRSGPNYQEEQFTPDEPEQTT